MSTKPSRKQIVKGFKAAKKFLAKPDEFALTYLGSGGISRKAKHICYALGDASSAGKISNDVDWHCSDIIMKRLGNHCGYLEQWLIRQGVPQEQMTFQNVQKHRLAWLDQLIAEFSKKD